MIDHVDYHVTDHCNLNCAGCNNFCPLSEPWCIPYEDFCKEWQLVKNKNLVFNEIRILGGETLLHPELDKLLIFLRGLFPTPKIVVYTNGILLGQQKEKLLPLFQKYNITLFISKYPTLTLDYNELAKGFPNSTGYYASSFMNTCLHTNPDFDPKHSFSNCNHASSWYCRALRDNYLYPCSVIPTIPILVKYYPELKDTPLGQVDIKESGINIENHSIKEIEDFIQHSVPFCAYCNAVNARRFRPWYLTEYKPTEWIENGLINNHTLS